MTNETESRISSRQNVISHFSGVELDIDRRTGEYHLRFDKAALEAAGKQFFDEQIKPILTKHHRLQGGNEVRFHWQPEEKDWAMRYRFIARDKDGNEIIEDGKKKYDNFHFQVQAIANSTADTIGRMLSEKLGLTRTAVLDV